MINDNPHDRTTAANTRPPDWANPAPRDWYDLVVVGGGTAGLVAAGTGSVLGARVALVERAYTGGDCLIAGCVPSKALLRAAKAAADARSAGRFGVDVAGVSVDFPRVMDRLRATRATISRADAVRQFAAEYNVDVFLGNARFTGPDTVGIGWQSLPAEAGSPAGGATLRFRRAILATGSRPAEPDVPGLAAVGYHTNETIFDLTARPGHLAVVGGGPGGCEFAQAFARLGSHVTLIHRGEQLLTDDARAAEVVRSALVRDGVDVRLNTSVTRADRGGSAVRLTLSSGTVAVDAVLVGVGRRFDPTGLGLDAAGVAHDGHGVHVDDFLRTTNRRVFAAGDACLRQRYTHAADASARVAAQNALLFRRLKRWSGQLVPHATYTDPEVAAVGLAERDADPAHHRTYTVPMDAVDRAVIDGADDGYLRVTVNRRSGRIVGATVVAAHAGDLLAPLTAAMVAGRRLSALADVIVPYPTQGDAVRRAADQAVRDRLSGWPSRALRWWTRRGDRSDEAST